MKNTTLYEQDFFAWTLQNAQLLRKGNLSEVDILHITKELDSMGKHDKRALLSHLTVSLMCLLKWQFQASFRSKSWELTIKVKNSVDKSKNYSKTAPDSKNICMTKGFAKLSPTH
jgi:hypothetical protein